MDERPADPGLTSGVGLGEPLPFEHVVTLIHVYRLVLHRPADRPGLRHHVEMLASGDPLRDVVAALFQSDEGRRLWRAEPDEAAARRLWHDAAPSYAGDADGFAATWRAAGGLADLVVRLVAAAAVRAVPVLHALFPGGVDPADDAAGPGWAYRLWALETERALSTIGVRLFPLLRLAGPVIGLVLEVGPDDPAGALADTLASLTAQIYGRWRLSVRGRLPAGAMLPADPRIATDDAEARPRAPWTGWLRAGDTLSASALALFAYAALRRPWASAIYCDEDLRQPDGSGAEPWLKTAWDPDAAEEADPVGALLLVRRRGRGRIGPHRPRPGAMAGRVVHLPAVLCHRPPAALRDLPIPAFPIGPAPPLPALSIVIATRDRADLLQRCIASLHARTDYPGIEIVLVDNGSREPAALALLDRLRHQGCTVLRRPGPFNWSTLNNDGVRASAGEVVVLMNNDVACIDPGWARALAAACLRPRVGIVGALLLYEDGGVQHAGVVVGPGAQAAHLWSGRLVAGARLQGLAAVTGACVAFRRSVFDRLGGLDEALPVTWNDVDFCLRLREAGLRVLLARDAVLIHAESATRSADSAPENQVQLASSRAWMAARHRRALRADPFLNPLLTAGNGGRLLDPAAPERLWSVLRGGGR